MQISISYEKSKAWNYEWNLPGMLGSCRDGFLLSVVPELVGVLALLQTLCSLNTKLESDPSSVVMNSDSLLSNALSGSSSKQFSFLVRFSMVLFFRWLASREGASYSVGESYFPIVNWCGKLLSLHIEILDSCLELPVWYERLESEEYWELDDSVIVLGSFLSLKNILFIVRLTSFDNDCFLRKSLSFSVDSCENDLKYSINLSNKIEKSKELGVVQQCPLCIVKIEYC